MKVNVIGLDWMEGVSKKTGNNYSIGRLFVTLPIDGKNAKGSQGAEYECTAELARRFDQLPFPFEAELQLQDVVRFGKRETRLVDVTPVSVPPARPAPVKAAA
jgi:hypothetical protein